MWVKIDDQFPTHPKVIKAGLDARALFITSLCYSANYLTDGFVTVEVTPLLTATSQISNGDAAIKKLIEVGLWEVCDGGYMIHDFLVYNPPSTKILEERRANAERQAKLRNKRNARSNGVTNGVTNTPPVPVPVPVLEKTIASDDADTAQKAKEVVDTVEKHRKQSERDKASEALEQHFVTLSGLPAPKWDTDKNRKASASRWKNPLLEIWELCGRDLTKAQAVIDKAHSQMTHDNLTISAPASVLEVAKSIYAKNGFHGKDKVIEWI